MGMWMKMCTDAGGGRRRKGYGELRHRELDDHRFMHKKVLRRKFVV